MGRPSGGKFESEKRKPILGIGDVGLIGLRSGFVQASIGVRSGFVDGSFGMSFRANWPVISESSAWFGGFYLRAEEKVSRWL